MKKIFEISKIIMLLFLPAVIWLISNNAINRHYHILNNGTIISHSHPYTNKSQSPVQEHDHSDFQYSVLAQITSNSNSETPEIDNVQVFVEFYECLRKPLYQKIEFLEKTQLPDLRAPPIV